MKKFLSLFTVLLLGTFLFAGSAGASFVLMIDDTSTVGIDFIVGDELPAFAGTTGGNVTSHLEDLGTFGMAGNLDFTTSIGNWTVVSESGQSKPVIGSPNSAEMSLNMNATSTGSGGTLEIWLTDTDFTAPAGNSLNFFSAFSTTLHPTGANISATAYLDPANAEFGTAGAYSLFQGAFASPPSGNSANVSTVVPGFAGLFSMTQHITLTHASSGGGTRTSRFDAPLFLQPVPEPGTILLLGAGLIGLAAARRRKES